MTKKPGINRFKIKPGPNTVPSTKSSPKKTNVSEMLKALKSAVKSGAFDKETCVVSE